MRLITQLTMIFSISLGVTICQAQELHLRDGTILKGKLLSYSNGNYVISSQTLGTVTIAESQVVTINQGPSGKGNIADPVALQQLQTEMLADQEVMQLLESLQNDPDVLNILQDPEIMDAIQRGDFDSLNGNQKLQKLLEKSQVKTIKKKYGE